MLWQIRDWSHSSQSNILKIAGPVRGQCLKHPIVQVLKNTVVLSSNMATSIGDLPYQLCTPWRFPLL